MENDVGCGFKIAIYKRVFDVLISLTLILILFPVFIIIAFLISFESRGGVIYRTKRVGGGLRCFTLYKFRSMHVGSDALLHNLKHLNLYDENKTNDSVSVFIKLKEDSRITRMGRLLRNTHVDELPQLFNVIKGDMSVVGNRPLEVYEAEKLIARRETTRFLSPAGITGLWQVRQYGKKTLVERERLTLDNFYADKQAFLFDLKIIIKTIPVIFKRPNC